MHFVTAIKKWGKKNQLIDETLATKHSVSDEKRLGASLGKLY